ncbi:MAG: FkbM family methyltransferase [Saprospiraceae bacterium]
MSHKYFVKNVVTAITKRFAKILSKNNLEINWLKEKYLKHAQSGVLQNIIFKGKVFYFKNPQEFIHTTKELFINEIYRIELPQNAYIIDCGANIGLSVLYFKLICPSAVITAFEPDSQNYNLLQKNVQSYNLEKVELRTEAVWNEDTLINFSSDGNMGSKIETNSNSNLIQAIRLKKFISQKVDLLKLDIEGAEYEVIKDIVDSLHFIKNIFLEYHGTFSQNNNLTEIFTIIQNAGFKYYIKEAANIYESPFYRLKKPIGGFDVQLNIFCFRD